MTLYLPDAKALFVHIPKTGGNWVRRAIEQLGIACRYAERRPDISVHCPPQFCRETVEFTFSFVRHPASWYESWWKYQRGTWRAFETDRWHPQRCLEDCASDDFPTFISQCMARQPAYITRLYEWYVGPMGAELDFVGRTESLASDLATVLDRLGYQRATVERLRTFQRENVSPFAEPPWTDDLKQEVNSLERAAIERFYGEMKGAAKHA